MNRVAVVGGGPGGLMAAHQLERHFGPSCQVSLFEASDRLGGKLQTSMFDRAPVRYEAGIAECYDYHGFGPDPLRDLVDDLGLLPRPTCGTTVVLNGRWLRDDNDIERWLGLRVRKAVEAFRLDATAMRPLIRWHPQDAGQAETDHLWADRAWSDILARIDEPLARRYIEVVSHSDLATEPHLTNGLVGLRTFLRSLPSYGAQYTIAGGMERLATRLAERLSRTSIELRTPVVSVARNLAGGYRLEYRRGPAIIGQHFDAVVVALPYPRLRSIRWAGERLERAMAAHIAHYDRPGHYLRVSVLFDRAFWRSQFTDSFVMLDAFDGCCLYDESQPDSRHGVLGWLLAGASASSLEAENVEQLGARVLNALPAPLREPARRHAIEVRVNRWIGALSGTPGGWPVKEPRAAHQPEPVEHPGLVLVGDHLFDSTLNGVLRSARLATTLLASQWEGRLPATGTGP